MVGQFAMGKDKTREYAVLDLRGVKVTMKGRIGYITGWSTTVLRISKRTGYPVDMKNTGVRTSVYCATNHDIDIYIKYGQ